MWDMRIWRVGSARNAVFVHSFVASLAGKVNSSERAGAEDRLPKMSPEFAPRLRARAIWKSKSLKTESPGALFEVQVAKICTTPARESDSEVKTVKTPWSRTTFGGSTCFSRGRRKDFEKLQKTWQAQEFVRVAKTLAGVVDLKRVRNDAFRLVGAGISWFVMSLFEASGAESVEALQISRHGDVTLRG